MAPDPDTRYPQAPITVEDFQASFGEELTRVLDVRSWQAGTDLAAIHARLTREVQAAVDAETRLHREIREEVFPELACSPYAPPGAGHYSVTAQEIDFVHQELLFPGGVEAANGSVAVTESLPLSVYHLGVGLLSYRGDQGVWNQRLFRRDLRHSQGDLVRDALDALAHRASQNGPGDHDPLHRLARRALLDYAERAVLLRQGSAPWRMGHGSLAPLELLVGGGSADLMIESVKLTRELVHGHQKFVFVGGEPGQRLLQTIGNALRPLEFAIVSRLDEILQPRLRRTTYARKVTVDATWDGQTLTPNRWALRFLEEVAHEVVVGVYRATVLAPPQVFYAHVDHADLAARIALADSVMNECQGFPLLLDLADRLCDSACNKATLRALTETAFLQAGAGFLYFNESVFRERKR